MRKPIFLVCVVLVLAISPRVFAHHSCPDLGCGSVQSCKDSASWVLQGTVTDIVSNGSHQECETGPGGPLCGTVVEPETMVLSNAKVNKGTFAIGGDGITKVTRKDRCFSGPLSVMNTKPELSYIGRRVLVFGNDDTGGFLRPGYFVVESEETK